VVYEVKALTYHPFTLTVPYVITANISHFYKCLSMLGSSTAWFKNVMADCYWTEKLLC